MTLFDIILLSIGLAMDCFAVSTALGCSHRSIATIWKVPVLFGLFQGLMPLIGFSLLISFADYLNAVIHWIALAILTCIGGKMIYEDIHPKDEEEIETQQLTWKLIILLAIATSIDALMTGGLFVIYPEKIVLAVLVIALGSFLFSCLGFSLGIFFGKKANLKSGILGGIILIGVGVKIVVEHYL
ncbi:MAG: manganese efflux pump [Bacteroidales bacterium]|nr:manganese efflux pump [Bacteroidales bacterium]